MPRRAVPPRAPALSATARRSLDERIAFINEVWDNQLVQCQDASVRSQLNAQRSRDIHLIINAFKGKTMFPMTDD
jgi:hypothetical protein